MDDLHKLWGFVQVAQAGTFSAAAERVGLSASALGKSVSRLEQSMGLRLFTRTTRSLHLTSEGQLLFDRMNRSFGDIEETLNLLRHAGDAPMGVVRLSAVTSYGRYSIIPILPEFMARYPLIDVRLSFHDGVRGLTRQAFDIRVTWGEEKERDKVAKHLCTMPLILVASPQYLGRKGMPRKPQDLEQHECIATALPDIERVHWVFMLRNGKQGTEPYFLHPKARIVVAGELDVVTDAALAGLGVTVISAHNVITQLQEGSLVRLLPQYEILGHSDKHTEIILQHPPRKHMAPRTRLMVDYLLEKLEGKGNIESL
jgi:DNA-binding transcriptional LysR family regulator